MTIGTENTNDTKHRNTRKENTKDTKHRNTRKAKCR